MVRRGELSTIGGMTVNVIFAGERSPSIGRRQRIVGMDVPPPDPRPLVVRIRRVPLCARAVWVDPADPADSAGTMPVGAAGQALGVRVRADTTVVSANVTYPTDSGLLARAVVRIGRLPGECG